MNFGQKFPYALLTFSQSLSKLIVGHTFSQSLSKLIVGHTLSQKFVEAGYWPHLFHARTPSPKVCQAGYWGTLHPNHYLHAQLHINPIPHTPYTNYTPTIHNPTTPPIPLLLRVDSDEMRQNRKVFAHEVLECSQRAPYGAKSPRSGHRAWRKQGSSLLDVCLLRARARKRRWMRSISPNPAEFAPSKFPQILQYLRKSHKQ